MEEQLNGYADAENIDLDEAWSRAWKDAEASFSLTHSESLRRNEGQTPEDVLNAIKSEKKKSDEDLAKHAKARTVIRRTINAVESLVEIAGQAASVVFGPASMCANAVTILINAGRTYKAIFTDLAELFEDIYAFLERFVVYKRIPNLDNKLKRLILEALLSFVRVCQVGADVLKHRMKNFFKSLVGAQPVQDELGFLTRLVQQESSLRGALGHETQKIIEQTANEIRDKVTETNEAVIESRIAIASMDENVTKAIDYAAEINVTIKQTNERQMKKDDQETHLEKVKKLLSQDSNDSSRDDYEENVGGKIQGTGEWLTVDLGYTKWADRTSLSSPILFLVGRKSSGKTFATYTAIQDLKSRYPVNLADTTRVPIAYHFCSSTQSVRKALKNLAYNVAVNDPVYVRQLANNLNRLDNVKDEMELWDKLFVQDARTDTLFFLILDGLEGLGDGTEKFEELLAHINNKSMSLTTQSLPIRLLVTATPEMFNAVKAKLGGTYQAINVEESNHKDMELFIKSKVDRMKIFEDKSPQVMELKAEVVRRLINLPTRKSFADLEFLLDNIDKKTVRTQVIDALVRAENGEGPEGTIKEEIRRCNESLSVYEKDELNEILLWVMCSARELTIGELKAVLCLTRSEPSLQSLYEQITKKFTVFFAVNSTEDHQDYHTVTISSEPYKNHLKKLASEQHKDITINQNSMDKSEIKILKRFLTTVCNEDLYYRFGFDEFFHQKVNGPIVNEAEVLIVKRFLSTVCDNKLYSRFGFDEFFAAKLQDTKTVGSFNLESGPAHLAFVCLKALCDDSDLAKPLRSYAGDHFIAHLKKLDLLSCPPEIKADIGPYLVRMFTDEKVIRRWWLCFGVSDRAWRWMMSKTESDAEIVLDCFRDAAILRKLSRSDQEWVRTLSTDQYPSISMLRSISKWIIKAWLTDMDWSWRPDLYYAIEIFINKLENQKDPEHVPLMKSPPQDNITTQAAISKTVAWAVNEVDVPKDFAYHFCLGETYQHFEFWSLAAGEFKQAVELRKDSKSWEARLNLLRVLRAGKLHFQVIEHAEAWKKDIENGIVAPSDDENAICEFLSILAFTYDLTEQHDKAFSLFNDLWLENPDNSQAICQAMTSLVKENKYEELNEFIGVLKKSLDEQTSLDRLSILYSDPYSFDELERVAESIGEIGIQASNCEYALDVIAAKIESATSKKTREELSVRLFDATIIYACLLIGFGSGHEIVTKGVGLLENVLLEKDLPEIGLGYEIGSNKLSGAYLMQIKANIDNPDICELSKNHLETLAKRCMADRGLNLSQHHLARCYSLLNHPEKARDSIKGWMKIGLDFLSDIDDENDWQGYSMIAKYSQVVGDRENALAAWSLIGPTIEDDIIELQKTDDTSPLLTNLRGPLNNVDCESCGISIRYSNNFWYCCDCWYTIFCDTCYQKHKRSDAKRAVCNAKHEFFHIPPWDHKKAAQVPPKHVRIAEDEFITIEEWKEKLKVEWNLSSEFKEEVDLSKGGSKT